MDRVGEGGRRELEDLLMPLLMASVLCSSTEAARFIRFLNYLSLTMFGRAGAIQIAIDIYHYYLTLNTMITFICLNNLLFYRQLCLLVLAQIAILGLRRLKLCAPNQDNIPRHKHW